MSSAVKVPWLAACCRWLWPFGSICTHGWIRAGAMSALVLSMRLQWQAAWFPRSLGRSPCGVARYYKGGCWCKFPCKIGLTVVAISCMRRYFGIYFAVNTWICMHGISVSVLSADESRYMMQWYSLKSWRENVKWKCRRITFWRQFLQLGLIYK